jgi:hypothetical protein
MKELLITLSLVAACNALGCSGGPPPPTSVSESERQEMIDSQKTVDEEERAHRRAAH